MRRILLVLSVAALMTAMLAASAAPAFARTLVWCNPPNDGNWWATSLYVCNENGDLVNEATITDDQWRQLEAQLYEYQ